MTITETEALEAMRSHHRALEDGLRTRVEALDRAAAGGGPHERAAAALVAYLADEVLPHAEAEEHTLYRAAGTDGGLAGTVREMTAEHRALATAAGRLAGAAGAASAAEQAGQIAVLFTAHVAKENEILLPALLAEPAADLTALLGEMHRRTGEARHVPRAGDPAAGDPQAAMLSLLLKAATELARAGHGDRACQLAASAWAELREPRPELAVRVTAALHGLARQVPAVPGTASLAASHARGAGPGGQTADHDLDVRDLAPAQRHESIFAAYGALVPGAGFVLVNDHDPRPLRYQFEAEHPGEFTWDSLEAGPEAWRVRIGRLAADDRAPMGAGGPGSGDDRELDVREIAHWQRHDVIFSTYRALSPRAAIVLVNDHDPLPLRYQFEAECPGAFTWEYLQAGPAEWRVRIGHESGRPRQ